MNLKNINPAIALTLSRLVLAPPFTYCFIAGMKSDASIVWLWASAALLLMIELSDAFDGHIARMRKQVTDFGKIVDPMADSISRQTIFLGFLLTNIMPLWMFMTFLFRDSILSTLRIMIAHAGTVQAARTSGKLKAILQAIGTALTLLVCLAQAYHIGGIPNQIAGFHVGFYIMLFPTLFTVLSAFDYLIPNWHIIRTMALPQSSTKPLQK